MLFQEKGHRPSRFYQYPVCALHFTPTYGTFLNLVSVVRSVKYKILLVAMGFLNVVFLLFV